MSDNRELNSGAQQSVETIVRELESQDQNTRDAAIARLEQMDVTALKSGCEPLVERLLWVGWQGDRYQDVTNGTVVKILLKIGETAAQHLQRLTEKPNYRLVHRACIALAKMGGSAYAPSARAKLAMYIENSVGWNEWEARYAISAMAAIGDEYVVDYLRLVALKKNPNELVRAEAAAALGQIGDERAIPDLNEALQDPGRMNVPPTADAALKKIKAKKQLRKAAIDDKPAVTDYPGKAARATGKAPKDLEEPESRDRRASAAGGGPEKTAASPDRFKGNERISEQARKLRADIEHQLKILSYIATCSKPGEFAREHVEAYFDMDKEFVSGMSDETRKRMLNAETSLEPARCQDGSTLCGYEQVRYNLIKVHGELVSKYLELCIKLLPLLSDDEANAHKTFLEKVPDEISKALTFKDKSSPEEMEQTDYTCELKDGRGELYELEMANIIKRRSLSENCGAVYRVLSKSQRGIRKTDKVHATGALTCSVCRKNFNIDFQTSFEGFFNFGSVQSIRCPYCQSSIQIIGDSTEIEKGRLKLWLIVLRNTEPANAHRGEFRLALDSLSIVKAPAGNSDDALHRSSSGDTPSIETDADNASKGEMAQPNKNKEAPPVQKQPVSSEKGHLSFDLKECPHCSTKGILPMSGNICPNCKKAL